MTAGTTTPTTQGCRRRTSFTRSRTLKGRLRCSWTPTPSALMALSPWTTTCSARMAAWWPTAQAGREQALHGSALFCSRLDLRLEPALSSLLQLEGCYVTCEDLMASARIQLCRSSYCCCSGGSDWRTVHVMAVDAASGEGRKLSEELQYVKFSGVTWTHDHKAHTCPCHLLLCSNIVAAAMPSICCCLFCSALQRLHYLHTILLHWCLPPHLG